MPICSDFGNDLDVWAFCKPNLVVKIHMEKEGDATKTWRVENLFSTLPIQRCQDETIEDPLLEPPKVSGSFVKYTEEAVKDNRGAVIENSSHELFHGPQVEFDANRPTVQIGMNSAALDLSTFASQMDTVNDAALWGLQTRMITLSSVAWERNLYGLCNFYYTRTFEFDINFQTFDRILIDEGTKCLLGKWNRAVDPPVWVPKANTNINNLQHFQRFKDPNGSNAHVQLDGAGNPRGAGAVVELPLAKYEESNFTLLGIPLTL